MRVAKLAHLAHLVTGQPQVLNFPRCVHCTNRAEGIPQAVHAVNLENANTKGVDVRAKCHGAEDVIHVEYSTPDDLQSNEWREIWRNLVFFDGQLPENRAHVHVRT